jgi:hypothetical protein
MSAYDAVDGCAGRPAEGKRCESVTVLCHSTIDFAVVRKGPYECGSVWSFA